MKRYLLAGFLVACAADPAAKPPPQHVTLDSVAEPAPPESQELHLRVASEDFLVAFDLDAPLQLIVGIVAKGVTGDLVLDRSNLEHTTGVVRLDLTAVEISRQGRQRGGPLEGESVVDPVQNRQMRTWLELSDDVPEEARAKHRYVEFRLDGLDQVSVPRLDLRKLPESLTATALGIFVLHGNEQRKRIPIVVSFEWEAQTLVRAKLRTAEKIPISLIDYDVVPREGYRKPIRPTLEQLADTVAPILEFEMEMVLEPAR